MKKIVFVIVVFVITSLSNYSQTRKVYNNIETQNVLYYKVEEIINMKFGGTTTRYTVSDLSLISKTNLGPDNIRIITPVYKEEKLKRKYYVETEKPQKEIVKNQEKTTVVEIAISEKSIEIPENPPLAKASLALVISNITNLEPAPVVKQEPQRESPDFIMVRAVEVYERVLEKGYKSDYMFKEVANFYYFRNQLEKAVKWYEELFAMNGDLPPDYYYRFGTALKKLGKTQRGDEMIEKYNKLKE